MGSRKCPRHNAHAVSVLRQGTLEFDFALKWREVALAHAAEEHQLRELHRRASRAQHPPTPRTHITSRVHALERLHRVSTEQTPNLPCMATFCSCAVRRGETSIWLSDFCRRQCLGAACVGTPMYTCEQPARIQILPISLTRQFLCRRRLRPSLAAGLRTLSGSSGAAHSPTTPASSL
eukprot:5466830-Pleurochrysis_carterae.AAC.1